MNESAKGPQSPDCDWGAIPQGEHFVQVYEDESELMSALGGFVEHALQGDAFALVVATAAHRSSLRARLSAAGHDPDAISAAGRYVALDAADTLSRFMVGGMPDPERFHATMARIVGPALEAGRPVHAFGEMVALLWTRGSTAATIELERLWNAFCEAHRATLFCAYPRIGASRDLGEAFAEVRDLHARVLAPA